MSFNKKIFDTRQDMKFLDCAKCARYRFSNQFLSNKPRNIWSEWPQRKQKKVLSEERQRIFELEQVLRKRFKSDFVVVFVVVTDEILSNVQRI